MRSSGLLQIHTLQDSIGHAAGGLLDWTEYLEDAAALLMKLIPGDTIGWNLVDRASRTAEVVAFPRGFLNDQKVGLRLAAVADDYPAAIRYLSDPSAGNWAPRRLSDLVTLSQLRRTRAYVELLHPVGADHQLIIPTANPTPDSGRAWAINRSGRDFSDRELEISLRLQPVLVVLERGAAAHLPRDRSGDEAAEQLRITARERQILQQVADGLAADEIGSLLRISPRTVRKHLENAYEKLGQHDRLRAVRRARELALVV
jgi:DNA-binding CsgD family transcriptional regulator